MRMNLHEFTTSKILNMLGTKKKKYKLKTFFIKAAKLIASCIKEQKQAGLGYVKMELLRTTLQKYGHFNFKIENHLEQNFLYNLIC